MSEFAAKEFLDQATQSLQNGQPQQALELAQNAIGLEPENADAFVLKGIAESQLNRPREAVDSFETAIKLAPQSGKAYFNFAVHYFGTGEKRLALDMARKAVECDAGHAGAKDLVQRLETELGVPSVAPPTTPSEAGIGVPPSQEVPQEASSTYFRPPDEGFRQGYERPAHTIRFVEGLGGKWDMIGWVLSILSLAVVGILFATTFGPTFEYMQKVMSGANPQTVPKPDFGMGIQLLQFFEYGLRLILLGWAIVDIADRKQNWLWMIPWVICCCCSFQGIVNIIYLLVSRAKK